MIISHKKLICYAFCYLTAFFLLIAVFFYFFDVPENQLRITSEPNSFGRALQIINNNLMNYLGYLITFLLYPIYIFLDLTLNAWAISVSLKAQGAADTFRHLALHGVIEIPNSILYTFLSFNAFRRFCKEKSFGIKKYFYYIAEQKELYILCFFLVIVAGLAEGLFS
ncbi:MAG: hypothetical protein VZR00_02895 [Lachnospiraceae bacterium]|nr:hypothetical protein [Lachnospiraceae bacterium]MEE3460824.1 hypothetical protein [Lachnospiraceae bacterium]